MIITIPKRGPVHIKLDSQDELTFHTSTYTDRPCDERHLTVRPAGFKGSWTLSEPFDATVAEDDDEFAAVYAKSIDDRLVARSEDEILKAFHAGTLS